MPAFSSDRGMSTICTLRMFIGFDSENRRRLETSTRAPVFENAVV